jgi:Fe-Mn family superoxide dismutase
MEFILPKLSYAYDALEPFIDAQTMELHYTKHHQAYITNLNDAIQKDPDLHNKSVEWLLQNIEEIKESSVKTVIKNHGGGHANHSLFWSIMMQPSSIMPQGPIGKLSQAINKKYQSYEGMKDQLSAQAKAVFGSGWVWLCVDKKNELHILSTPNQDSPLMQGLHPILGIDVWEHAYYLKYQNKRPDYIAAWWNVVNWDYVSQRYDILISNN